MSVEKNRQPATRAEQLRQKRQQSEVQTRSAAVKNPAPRVGMQVPPVPRGGSSRPFTSFTRGSASRTSTPVTRGGSARVSNEASARSIPHVSPVISRSIRYGTPLRQNTSTQPRRKVIYTVGANGVETRMPALPIIQFNWQMVSGFLTIGCIILVILLTNLSMFEIKTVNVEGFQRVTPAELQAVLQNNSGSVFTLDRTKALNTISVAFPELKNIRIRISMPDGINVSADERQPILAWKTGDQLVWIDADGVIMQPRGDVGTLLTVESGATPPLTKSEEKIDSVVDYAEMVIEQKSAPLTPEESIKYLDPGVLKIAIDMSALMPQGSTLAYDPISGMGWNDPGGWKVYFGNDLENFQFKQVEYQAIMQQLSNQGITPVMVSVKHVDSPYYRTE